LEDVSKYFLTHTYSSYDVYSVGRVDDVVVQSNGQKTLPGAIEDVILSSPL
jgi:long-subunit acyl-CoA synthetase (AMP-forming)